LALYVDVWVYPFLKVMSWPFRILFFAASLSGFVLLYLLSELMNRAPSASGQSL
jgi:hypothetical protein